MDADRKKLVDELVSAVADNIMVLRIRDGLEVTRADAEERARNLACLILLKYDIRRKHNER